MHLIPEVEIPCLSVSESCDFGIPPHLLNFINVSLTFDWISRKIKEIVGIVKETAGALLFFVGKVTIRIGCWGPRPQSP